MSDYCGSNNSGGFFGKARNSLPRSTNCELAIHKAVSYSAVSLYLAVLFVYENKNEKSREHFQFTSNLFGRSIAGDFIERN